VAPDVVVLLENREIEIALEEVGAPQAGDSGSDDGK